MRRRSQHPIPADDLHDFAQLSRRDRLRLALLVVAVIAAALWISLYFLQPAPPRRIVLASGPEFGLYHRYAQRYRDILGREGVTVRERITDGAAENLKLLLDPKSGVDVAFMQGGVAASPAADDLVMVASLYYEPLWIFYRGSEKLSQINQLHGKRVAAGVPGSGSAPSIASRARTSLLASAALSAALSFLMIGRGVPGGATSP